MDRSPPWRVMERARLTLNWLRNLRGRAGFQAYYQLELDLPSSDGRMPTKRQSDTSYTTGERTVGQTTSLLITRKREFYRLIDYVRDGFSPSARLITWFSPWLGQDQYIQFYIFTSWRGFCIIHILLYEFILFVPFLNK